MGLSVLLLPSRKIHGEILPCPNARRRLYHGNILLLGMYHLGECLLSLKKPKSTDLIFHLHGSVDLYGTSIMFMSVFLKEDSYENHSSLILPQKSGRAAEMPSSPLTSRMNRAMLPSSCAKANLSYLLKRCGRWLMWALKQEWVRRQILSRPFLGKFILQINRSWHHRVRIAQLHQKPKSSWHWEESKEPCSWCLLALRWAVFPLKHLSIFEEMTVSTECTTYRICKGIVCICKFYICMNKSVQIAQ